MVTGQVTTNNTKVLYKKNWNVPDNHVRESFLTELKKNLNVRLYGFSTVSMTSSHIAQHIALILIQVAIFILFSEGTLLPEIVLGCVTLTVLVAYSACCLLLLNLPSNEVSSTKSANDSFINGLEQNLFTTVFRDCKQMCLLMCLLFILSPILNTLTAEISSDTIYALSTCCFLLNIIFHNYGNYSSLMFSPVSLNCAIFVSVLLASRLDGTLHTFTLVLLSFVFFAFAPKLTEKMQDTYPVQTVLFNIFAAVFACTCFLFISRAVFLLIVSLFIAILVFLPCLFVRMQSLKNTIHGPWDEAVLVVD